MFYKALVSISECLVDTPVFGILYESHYEQFCLFLKESPKICKILKLIISYLQHTSIVNLQNPLMSSFKKYLKVNNFITNNHTPTK